METLNLVRNRLGITSTVRDDYIAALIEGVRSELEDRQGIKIDDTNPSEQMFLVDYVIYRYQNTNDLSEMPKHLHWRLRNLMVKNHEV